MSLLNNPMPDKPHHCLRRTRRKQTTELISQPYKIPFCNLDRATFGKAKCHLHLHFVSPETLGLLRRLSRLSRNGQNAICWKTGAMFYLFLTFPDAQGPGRDHSMAE